MLETCVCVCVRVGWWWNQFYPFLLETKGEIAQKYCGHMLDVSWTWFWISGWDCPYHTINLYGMNGHAYVHVLALVTPTTNSKAGPWTIIYLHGMIKIFWDLPSLILQTQTSHKERESPVGLRLGSLIFADSICPYYFVYKLVYFPPQWHHITQISHKPWFCNCTQNSLCTRSRTHRGPARWGENPAWWWRGCTTSWSSGPCQCSSSPRGSIPAGSWYWLAPACSQHSQQRCPVGSRKSKWSEHKHQWFN